jgi:lambda family phage minor tail protein L
MTLPSEIAREAQKLATDRLVRLYELDATEIGGVVFRFTSSVDAKLELVSITHSGSVATVETANPHAMLSGDPVRVVNADQPEYNGDHNVTVVDSTHFTYTIFSTPASDATGYYLQAVRLNNTMVFDGNEYIPIEIDVSGFEWDGQGNSLPTPRLLISNKHRILMSSVIALKNLTGAKFTRLRTFRKHLDDGSDPDSTMLFPKEIYRVNRKVGQNKIYMEFELASSLDQEGVQIPGEQCLRDTCLARYRVYNATLGGFDYSRATCPYVGSTYFTAAGVSTPTASEDRCGKHLSDCTLRFGNAPLPFRGTPGIGGR